MNLRGRTMGQTYVALMRGINVGGKNKLPMKQLTAMFEDLGCTDVRTYIQSGNVVFGAEPDLAESVPVEIPRRIDSDLGYSVPVVLRSAADLRAAVDRHPFVDAAEDTKHLHVGFLADAPTDDQIAKLDPARSDVDSFDVIGREVHLHVPGGMGRTKLTTGYFDRRLDTVMTVRNWRTVNRLLEMAGGD
ncbi:MAG: DUF1697 domain-containing protein [Gemmatimonadota bacterium]|jgi:uncharacterized protein (DUF1697 family)